MKFQYVHLIALLPVDDGFKQLEVAVKHNAFWDFGSAKSGRAMHTLNRPKLVRI